MIAWFVHGWGFGPSIWDELAARLPDLEPRFADLGYFGGEGERPPEETAIWVTHSFGTMHALSNMSANCRALVAVNGFDRFVGGDGFDGVPKRVLDRMIARFESDPPQVVSEFRRKCGNDVSVDHIDSNNLGRDLVALRHMDCGEQAAALTIPVLSLQGGADPILPPALRTAVLPGAHRETNPSAGHLLPLEAPDWCAERIGEFVAEVAS